IPLSGGQRPISSGSSTSTPSLYRPGWRIRIRFRSTTAHRSRSGSAYGNRQALFCMGLNVARTGHRNWKSTKTRAALSGRPFRILQFAKQPGSSQTPLAISSAQRYTHDFCGFLRAQAPKEPEFDELRFFGIECSELIEGNVHVKDIGVGRRTVD